MGMGVHFDQHSLGRRIVAIAAAYVIALSALIASFAAARAAAVAIVDPLGVICHIGSGSAPSPSGNEGDARHCIDACSAGCLPLAALPPPPGVVHTAPLPIPLAKPVAVPVVADRLDLKSHRSRAPPQAL
jgi:hypothetical protein